MEEEIGKLQSSKADIQSYITQLDAEMAELEARLAQLSEDIEGKQEEIAATEVELEEAIATVDEQYEAMKLRIQYTYENGGFSYLTILLESESITDFINRADYATQMVEYDRRMLEEYQLAQQKVEDTKAQLETEEQELSELQADVEEQRESLDLLIDAKTQEIASYQAKIENAEAEADDYSDQLAEQERLLDQIEDQIAAEAAAKAQELENTGTVTPSASGFVWPCPSSHRITSGFGPRSQPTAGASTNHKGIDIGASTGSAIIASASGVVTTATLQQLCGELCGDLPRGRDFYGLHALFGALCICGTECEPGRDDRRSGLHRVFHWPPPAFRRHCKRELCESSGVCKLSKRHRIENERDGRILPSCFSRKGANRWTRI